MWVLLPMRDKNNLIKETQNDADITLTCFHTHCLYLSANYHFYNRKKKGYFSTASTYNLLSFAFYFLQIGFYIYQLFYALLPKKISEFLFLPIWFFLCILGFITFWREWENNRVFSICIGFLSLTSFLFGLLLLVISGM